MKLRLPKMPGKRLDARGLAHITLPLLVAVLVAIGGTYALVASHADAIHKHKPKPVHHAVVHKPKPKKTPPPKSYLVVYSSEGKYDTVKIHALNPSGALKCGGNVSSGDVIKSLSPKKSLKLLCSPTTGTEAYYVYFGQNKNFPKNGGNYVAVNVSAGYCTLVHARAALNRLVPLSGNTCVGANTEPDTPTKTDVNLTIQPKLSPNGKNIEGTIMLTGTTDGITRVECAGQITIQHNLVYPGGGMASYAMRHYSLRFVNSGKGYCIAHITSLQNVTQGNTYQLDAWFSGNNYFNTASAKPVNITVPPKVVSVKTVKGSNQPCKAKTVKIITHHIGFITWHTKEFVTNPCGGTEPATPLH